MAKYVGIIPHKTNNLILNETSTVIHSVGDIVITTNLNVPASKTYSPPKFSDFYTKENLPYTSTKNTVFAANKQITTSLDYSNTKYFAKFGSLLELIRVSIDTIVYSFPASIHSKTTLLGKIGYNIINAGYSNIGGYTEFLANTSYFSNPFGVYYQDNSNFTFQEKETNEIRNLSKNYNKYSVVFDGVEYPILEFTPSKKKSDDFIKLKIQGNPLEIGNNSKEFYIKPNELEFDKFYDSLDDFEAYLLNRNNNYQAIFADSKEVDGGILLRYKLGLTFPLLDDFNLDISTSAFSGYQQDLYDFAIKFDETEANLLMRKLVPDNVQSVTLAEDNAIFPTYGEINRLLIIYGREFDKLNAQIENIRFFNTVTYNGLDNIPEAILFEFVRGLGWDFENTNLSNESLRLLALNSAWVFKSKGTRAAIDFVFNFLGIPAEIVDFNEYVIRARKPIDVEKLKFFYSLISPDTEFDLSTLPIDNEGYPTYQPNTEEDYFQRYGEMDRGLSYFYKYVNLFPDGFTGASINYVETKVSANTLFEQNFDGTGSSLAYQIVDASLITNGCYIVSGETILDPYPEIFYDECGCKLPISDNIQKICVEPIPLTGCTPIILDVFYDCISGNTAILHVNVYGGKAPHTIYGVTDGQTVLSGETYNIYAADKNGCLSDITTITIDCPNPCFGNEIFVDLDYVCLLDEFGQNTGQATILLNYSGGTEPYNIVGVQSGDTINHGEIVTVTITDANGCTSGLVGLTIDCPPPAFGACEPITLNASLETTSISLATKTANVNVVYSIEDIPFNYIIDTVTLTTVGLGSGDTFVVGSPVVTNFNSLDGADTIGLNYTPLEVQNTITLVITINIVFANGCEYEDTFNLTVNPRQLGNVDYYNAILS